MNMLFDILVNEVVATTSKHIIWNGIDVASKLTKLLGDCLGIPRVPLGTIASYSPNPS